MTVSDLLHAFVQHQASLGRAPRTLDAYRLNLGKVVALWGPDLDCQLVTYQLCQAYRETNIHCSPGTRGERMILLRQWLAWGVKEGHLWKNPAGNLREPILRPSTAWVPTQEQVSQLLAAPRRDTVGGLRDATLLELIYGTGIRRRELYRLSLNDWLSERGGLWVKGKGNKPRFQPIGDNLAKLLEQYLSEARPLLQNTLAESAFLLDNLGRRYPYYRLAPCLYHYCQRANLPEISPHALRRAFATHLLLRGAELHEVQVLLGHSNPQVTQRYTKIEVVDLQREYQRTHPRAELRRLSGRAKMVL